MCVYARRVTANLISSREQPKGYILWLGGWTKG